MTRPLAVQAFEVDSQSTPGISYTVIVVPEIEFELCTCKGFEIRHTCKHVEAVLGIAAEQPPRLSLEDGGLGELPEIPTVQPIATAVRKLNPEAWR